MRKDKTWLVVGRIVIKIPDKKRAMIQPFKTAIKAPDRWTAEKRVDYRTMAVMEDFRQRAVFHGAEIERVAVVIRMKKV